MNILIPLHGEKIVLAHIITSEETITLTAKEFLWFESVKLWQQQGKGEDQARIYARAPGARAQGGKFSGMAY